MSLDTVIHATGLGKQYRLGGQRSSYRTLREALAELGSKVVPGRKTPSAPKAPAEDSFWALRDVNFQVRQGEVLGIIGHNGAGKSTLLKILARITAPTEGAVRIRGRVGSLLEVGTGFHPELSGRQNIYLNGSILGMSRGEITRKLDAVVDFSGVERFIDMPVKRYSSGMYMRLAFGVAAHLEADILLVDEVLAVGDAAFQKKCLGKMEEISRDGRAVIFVSHNLTAITGLCDRALLLAHGQVQVDGPVDEVLHSYAGAVATLTAESLAERTDRRGEGSLRFLHAWLGDAGGNPVAAWRSGEDAFLHVTYRCEEEFEARDVLFSATVLSEFGQTLLHLRGDYVGDVFNTLPPSGTVRCHVPRLPLLGGTYTIGLFSEGQGRILDWVTPALTIDILDGDYHGTGRQPIRGHTPFLTDYAWSIISDSDAPVDPA